MITDTMQKAFLSQINKELFSEYLYLSMKAYFADKNLKGFVNWMAIQVQEEHAHAMGMFDYILERGGKIELEAIEKPKCEWASPLEVFRDVVNHEQYITSQINALYDVADSEHDRAAQLFLNWYVKEQVEEEASAGDILAHLELIGNDTKALHKELAARVFNPPVIG
jgi:ferritin